MLKREIYLSRIRGFYHIESLIKIINGAPVASRHIKMFEGW